jgi:hypothetical protein
MSYRIEVEGLDPILQRMQQFPQKLKSAMFRTLSSSIIALQGAIKPYPPKPADSTYKRTEILGKSLGSGYQGGRVGAVDKTTGIATVEQRHRYQVATFGTRVQYAKYVIGEGTQAAVHKGRWWTLVAVAKSARPNIEKLFQAMANGLARWLDGR